MTYKTHTSTIRTLKQGDPNFVINDGLMQTPRAGFEISQRCPDEHKWIIQQCIENGWIKPVAHVTERELLFMGLTK